MNPVLRKDILGLLRLKRVAAIQVFFVLVLAALVIQTWPQGGVLSLAAQGQDTLLLGLILGQLVLLVLFVPGIASVALTSEKEQNTLEMLYASRLSPSQIISGKILGSISFPILLLLSGLPFLALLHWRGAVNAQQLTWAYLILVTAAIFLAMVSLTISALCKQSATALVISYLTVLVICGGTLVPAAIMLEAPNSETEAGANHSAQILHYSRSVSPVAAVLSLLRPQLTDFGGEAHRMMASWVIFLPIAFVVILICFAILVVVLARPPVSPDGFGAPIGGNDAERSLGRRMMYLIDPKKKRKAFGSFNPLISKEARTNNLRSGRWMIRIFYGSLFVSLGLAVMSLSGGAEHADLLRYVAQVLVAFQIGVIALVDPSLTAAAVSAEIENGTFETLRLTRLGGSKIFWGKFIPAFFPALLPVLALMPGYMAVCYIEPGYIIHLLHVLAVVVLAVVFCCTLGLCCSCFVNNTARATVAAYLITAGLFVLPLFAWWSSGEQLRPELAAKIAMASPLVMAMNQLPKSSRPIEAMFTTHLWFMGGLCLLMLIIARIRLSALLKKG